MSSTMDALLLGRSVLRLLAPLPFKALLYNREKRSSYKKTYIFIRSIVVYKISLAAIHRDQAKITHE
jgi:hypothetical protein